MFWKHLPSDLACLYYSDDNIFHLPSHLVLFEGSHLNADMLIHQLSEIRATYALFFAMASFINIVTINFAIQYYCHLLLENIGVPYDKQKSIFTILPLAYTLKPVVICHYLNNWLSMDSWWIGDTHVRSKHLRTYIISHTVYILIDAFCGLLWFYR